MDFFGRGSGGCRGSQEQALGNPIRLRILELFTDNEARPLTAAALASDLGVEKGAFVNLSVGQLGYHLARLRDAGLIPSGNTESRGAE
jgi:DNA-binding transcriptional ArsR family regulator